MKYPNPLTGEMNELDPENPEPGIYAGVPSQVYLKIRAKSRSSLMDFNEAPEYWAYRKPKPSTPAQIFGTQYHAYVLTPDIFKEQYHEGPVTKSGNIGVEFRVMQEQYGADYVYKPSDMETFEAMKEASKRYPKQHAVMFNSLVKEVVVIAYHESTGYMLKIMMDFPEFTSGYIVDFKTTHSVKERSFHYSCRDYGYYLQAGYYVFVCSLLPELRHMRYFRIIAQEKDDPYIVRTFDLGEHISDNIIESERILGSIRQWVDAGSKCHDEAIVMPNYSFD